MLRLTVRGQRELQDLANDLRRAKGTLRRDLVKAFKDAGQPTLRAVKTNVETMRIRGYRTRSKARFTQSRSGTNLRKRISRVTELEISSSSADPRVSFVVHTDRLGSARNVPWHLDSGKQFRHPIMGNRNAWAASSGTPWFYDEIRNGLDLFVAECDRAIEHTIQTIERG
jgi:hypothetical protein